jgi:DNA-binding NarL/FixJ family response regulator
MIFFLMSRRALATREPQPPRLISRTTITDPRGALRLAREGTVDAVALRLPAVQAMPIIPRLRRIDPKLIVILVNGDRRKEVRHKALRSGDDAIVPPASDLESQVGLLETAAETVQLVAVNQKLMKELLESARSLDAAIRKTAETRKNAPRPARP